MKISNNSNQSTQGGNGSANGVVIIGHIDLDFELRKKPIDKQSEYFLNLQEEYETEVQEFEEFLAEMTQDELSIYFTDRPKYPSELYEDAEWVIEQTAQFQRGAEENQRNQEYKAWQSGVKH
ncbi:MAG: hypothetical protein PF542_05575 [Nanoarchaeota archaeon]|jgi:hypothetical protein|nr:hypothetical protein [Nanoarchaeota archaeon]